MTPAEVRAARRALGLSQKALAEQLGVTETTVWRWEHPSGRWPVDRPEMLRLALVGLAQEMRTPGATAVAGDATPSAAR
ncbi:MAG TPA: helix-turn-helix domain-containing protein [Chloroflexota bacterium]|jgi:DNA-binding transcriptional regulator YiaG|nr:helix-turn-helix domain-containing protein [Chloroflexota bacterium]